MATGGFQKLESSKNVGLGVEERISHGGGYADLGGQVEDEMGIFPAEGLVQLGLVDVGVMEVDAAGEVCQPAGTKIVQHDYPMAQFKEPVDQVGADESGASGD
jgi:hypothetical protein